MIPFERHLVESVAIEQYGYFPRKNPGIWPRSAVLSSTIRRIVSPRHPSDHARKCAVAGAGEAWSGERIETWKGP